MRKFDMTERRIVVMQRSRDHAWPVSVHDTLDSAMADIGERAATVLVENGDTASCALYFFTIGR